MLGEQLQQHAVRHAPVDDDDGLDARLHHLDAALDLRDHAAGDGAVADHLARFGNGQLGDELLVLVEHARDVGQQQQALGLHARGERAGEGIGVDVEGLALARHADRGDDRNEVRLGDHLDDVRVDLDRIADIADVHRLHDVGLGVRHLGDLLGDHQVGILAADADSLAALPVDGADDLLVDGAGQHHLDHFDRRLVGDAQAVHEVGFDLELLQHGRDLRAAAMDDDRIDAGLLEVDDVLGESVGERLVAHGIAAELDDDGLLIVADEVRQGLGEDGGLFLRVGDDPCRLRTLFAHFAVLAMSQPSRAVCTARKPSLRSPYSAPGAGLQRNIGARGRGAHLPTEIRCAS